MGNQASTQSAFYEQWQRNGNADIKDVDPKDVFGLRANFSWQELKDAYRRTALWVHPDKGGSEAMFNYVTKCFKTLALEVKSREAERPHHDLKKASEAYYASQQPPSEQGSQPTRGARIDPKSPTFGVDFNTYFEKNKMQDDDDETTGGYGNMMEPGGKRVELENPKLVSMKGKFNAKTFNRAFEKETTPSSKDVTIYKEPEVLTLTKRLEFTEIGGGRPDDYTHAPIPGRGGRRGGMAYTDYKVATSSSRLVDPRSVQSRPDFKTVEEYTAHRDKVVEGPLTHEELAWKAEKERAEEEREASRRARAREQDARYTTHYGELMRNFIDK
jgi:hypothetical protein